MDRVPAGSLAFSTTFAGALLSAVAFAAAASATDDRNNQLEKARLELISGSSDAAGGARSPSGQFYKNLRHDFPEIDWHMFDWERWNSTVDVDALPTSLAAVPIEPRFWGVAAHSGNIKSLAADHLRPLGVRHMQVHTNVRYCEFHDHDPAVVCGEMPGLEGRMQQVLKGSVGGLREVHRWEDWILAAARAQGQAFEAADVLLCQFPPAACSAFLRRAGRRGVAFRNKHLLIELGWRHDMQRHGTAACQWAAQLAAVLRESPKHLVVAHTAYDVAYVHHFTGLGKLVQLIEYTSGGWLAAAAEVPESLQYVDPRILLLPDRKFDSAGRQDPDQQVARFVRHIMEVEGFDLSFARELYGSYTPAQVLQHRAAVAFPYSAYSFQLADWYWLGMTIFVPTPAFLAHLHFQFGLLYELVANCASTGLPCQGCCSPGWNTSASGHVHAPRSIWDSKESAEYWFRLFWIYNVPGFRYFSGTTNLAFQLKEFQVADALANGRRIRRRNMRVLRATRWRWRDLLTSQLTA